jgi:3-deoxy-7-phosphoheptulonate synthase
MIDVSHGNSQKQHKRQIEVANNVAQQIAAGENYIMGVMIESHLVEGRQNLKDIKSLRYGQSITDACLSFDDTTPLLDQMAEAVRQRRQNKKP